MGSQSPGLKVPAVGMLPSITHSKCRLDLLTVCFRDQTRKWKTVVRHSDTFHPLLLLWEDLPTSFQSGRYQSSDDAVLVTFLL